MNPLRQRAAIALAVAAACAMPLGLEDYQTFQLTLTLCYALAILGLNMLTGYCGQLSLGHGAFFALGGYTAGILLIKFHVPYWLIPPAAAVIGLAAGWLFGRPALRLQGHHLALATFALALAVPQVLKHQALAGWTGGVTGLVLQKPAAPAWTHLTQDQWLYYFALIHTLAGFWLARNLLRSAIGLGVTALRDHPVAATAMGVDVARHKTMMFGLSATYTSVAGALSAITLQYVAPDSFGIMLSIALLVGAVVGGLGAISGAWFGAVFIQYVPDLAESVSKSAPAAVYALLLIAVGLFATGGIAGLLRGAVGRIGVWRRRGLRGWTARCRNG
jgi:branched-chain amino acid transport system permease protein